MAYLGRSRKIRLTTKTVALMNQLAFFVLLLLPLAALAQTKPKVSKDAEAYFNRGLAKYYQEDYTGAIADYTKAIEIDPKLAAAYYNRGAAKARLKDYTGAIADYFVPRLFAKRRNG